MKNPLVATVLVEKPLETVWKYWTDTHSIKQWNIPFEDWHCPKAENNFYEGGTFFYRMEHIDGKEGFDYTGVYDKIIPLESIESTCDERKNLVEFQQIANNTIIRETFEPENKTSLEEQQNFTNSVLENFKKFAENV